MRIWTTLTMIAILIIAVGPVFLHDAGFLEELPDELNEWGDYFAGSLAPIALAWFIATLFMQAKELSLQREQLGIQASETKLARKQAEAQTRNQLVIVRLERSKVFLERSNRLLEEIEHGLRVLSKRLPSQNTGSFSLDELTDHLERLIYNDFDFGPTTDYFRQYLIAYGSFCKEAIDTDNVSLIHGARMRLMQVLIRNADTFDVREEAREYNFFVAFATISNYIAVRQRDNSGERERSDGSLTNKD